MKASAKKSPHLKQHSLKKNKSEIPSSFIARGKPPKTLDKANSTAISTKHQSDLALKLKLTRNPSRVNGTIIEDPPAAIQPDKMSVSRSNSTMLPNPAS